MKKRIIVIDTDEEFFSQLLKNFEVHSLNKDFELTLLTPDTQENNSLKIYKQLKDSIKDIETTDAFLVDINIVDGGADSYGITFASELRYDHPNTPIFNITNKTSNEIEFDALSLATLEDVDGVLVKSFFDSDHLSKDRISELFEKAHKKRANYSNPSADSNIKHSNQYDIAIITALRTPEFESVEKIIEQQEVISKPDLKIMDSSIYYSGVIAANDGTSLKCVLATDDKMGMSSASSITTRVIQSFRPKLIVMLGIAAGIKDKTKIGDILIGDSLWDYGSGRIEFDTENSVRRFKPYIDQVKLNNELRSILSEYVGGIKGEVLYDVHKSYDGPRDKLQVPNIKIGPFASGAAVISNATEVEQIKDQHPKLIGFDMETYGLFKSASMFKYPLKVMSIKSASDHGTEDKAVNKDLYQHYASFTSAQFFLRFIRAEYKRLILG